jgi:hypothetical protein
MSATVMERFRLHPDCIELREPLDAASETVRAQVGWAVAQWAIRRNCLSHSGVTQARLGGPPEPVADVVKQLDDLYFDLEAGGASDAAVQAAFRRARAANALEYAMQGNAYEAIYEARASTEDVGALHQVVLQALGRHKPGDGHH